MEGGHGPLRSFYKIVGTFQILYVFSNSHLAYLMTIGHGMERIGVLVEIIDWVS